MAVFKDVQGLRHWRRSLEGTVALVPTMGNLHQGHLALVQMAAQRAEHVLVSIYVNPLQFGRNEDLAAYPRTLEADLALLHRAGVAAVFIPDDTIMYPRGRQDLTLVMPSLSLSRELCGRSRPGHFAGVCTVVGKLFHICGPEMAVFGEKDWQQLRVVARMVEDLDFPVQILSVPTQRETDGLACSSRNRYLSPEERRIAPLLYRTLEDLARRTAQGHNDTGNLRQAAWEGLDLAGFIPEYLELRDADTLHEPSGGALRWFAAARLGKTRLIDNVPVPPVNP